MPTLALAFAAAANGALLALILALHPRLRFRVQARRLAALLACGSAVTVLIVLEHAGLVWSSSILVTLEESLTLLSGPLLLAYVRGSVNGRAPGPLAWLPWLAHALAAVVAGDWLHRHVDIVGLVFVQMAYTAASAHAFLHHRRALPESARNDAVALPIGTMLAAHAAQVVRMTWPDVAALENVVPATLSLAFLALQAHALLQSRALAGLATPSPAPEALEARRDDAQQLDAWLRRSEAWREPASTFESVAHGLQWSTARLGAAIAAIGETSVHGVLNRYRLAEVKRLLADPAERRYAVEGLGRQAGFGSRSGFYKVFRSETGLSPADYRRRHAGG